MKKAALPLALLLACVGLSGCPVYDDDDLACFDDYDCPSGHWCDYPSGACITEQPRASCDAPTDCAANETCSKNATCVVGDCSFSSVGCVRGFECSSESGRWECVPRSSGSGGQPNGGDGGAPVTNQGGAPMSAGGAPLTNQAGAPLMSAGGVPDSNGGAGG